MDLRHIFVSVLAYLALMMPILGMLIGLLIYNKKKEKVKKKVEEQYRQAQERGGVSSLYYKHPERRVFGQTFGIPMIVGLLLGVAILLLLSKVS